jgi:hypothetical protein
MNERILQDTKTARPTRRTAMAGLLALPVGLSAAETAGGGDAELLKVRESVWRDWFSGNRKALMAILPEDFVGIGAGGGAGQTRAETVTSSEAFAAGGGRLVTLAFSDNRIQKIGNVSIIYCGFTFTTQDRTGASNTVTGRATEVFLRSARGWQHPGWHLDSGN